MRQNYSGNKKRREEAKRKKKEEKKNRRLNRQAENAAGAGTDPAVNPLVAGLNPLT